MVICYNYMMIDESCLSQISLCQSNIKSTMDEALSLFSSATAQRISRKPNHQVQRRQTLSNSRASSEKSGKGELNAFYTKISKIASVSNLVSPRKNNLEIGEPATKTRTPTPVPGYNNKSKPALNRDDAALKYELQLAELSKKYHKQKQQKDILMKNIYIYQKQIKAKISKVKDLEKAMLHFSSKDAENHLKLIECDHKMKAEQNSLRQTRSQLQKLQQKIQKSRVSQLQAQNAQIKRQNFRLREANGELSKSVEQLCRKMSSKQVQLVQLGKQIGRLAQLVCAQRPSVGVQTQQERMEEMVNAKNAQIMQLGKRIQKLQMQNSCLNRRRNEEIEHLKESKNKEIERIRDKLLDTHCRYIDSKQECSLLRRQLSTTTSNSLMLHQPNNSDEHFQLQLSP